MLGSLAVTMAVNVARTEEGAARLALLATPAANRPAPSPDTPQTASLTKNLTRLQSELRRSALEKAELSRRLASLEEQATPPTTGSIPPTASYSPPADGPSAQPGQPRPARVVYGAFPSTEGEASPPVAETRDEPPRAEAAGRPALMQTSFAVEIATAGSMAELKERWGRLAERHAPELRGLDPLVAVRETVGGALELRLLAGPVTNAADAIRLCTRIRDIGTNCIPVSYEGQRLALY